MNVLPISSRLLLPTNSSSFLSRLGRRAGGVGTEIPFFSSCWVADNQRHFKEGLALQTFLALVREGKRKRGVRNFSVTSVAESISPEEVEHLHVTESEPPQDLKRRDSKMSAGGVWRRQGHPDNADKLSASIFVDPPFLEFLTGKGGTTRQKIEKDTGVTLLIPFSKEAKAGKHVVIQGESQEALEKATQQVHEVIDQAIKSPQLQYSHFISIPLALHPKLLESVIDFEKSVLESGASSSDGGRMTIKVNRVLGIVIGTNFHAVSFWRNEIVKIDPGLKDKGIDKSIFVKPATFHLTLLMLKLWNNDRVQAAADCLQRIMPRVHEALEGSPLTIKLTGVDCMNGNPPKAHVLYADVEPDDQAVRLITASQVITEAFTQAGLVMDKDKTQTLKLHATLMNTSHRSRGGFGKSYHKRIPFDATEIMTKYEQYKWGEYHVSEAHLSQRFLYDENGHVLHEVLYLQCRTCLFPMRVEACDYLIITVRKEDMQNPAFCAEENWGDPPKHLIPPPR